MTKEQILKYLSDNKKEFRDRFQIKKIGLFGSYARDDITVDSDIDIIVNMPSDLNNFFELKNILENNFGKKVDLGLENSIRLLIKDSIKNEVIYV
ncbi:MAG: nucleotidyltransferase family protein [Candidatus Marinimicrobia bacterium]|nr:nucleotidyltransferase family protein [Candidatus Neomarinimicrobiota bacterium]